MGLDVKILHEYSDDNGRILALKCKIQDHSFLLVNFYNENQQNEQLEALENLNRMLLNIDLEPENKIIPGGDFNLIFDIKLEFDGGKSTLKYSSISKVELIKEKLDLCDIFRVRNPTAIGDLHGDAKHHLCKEGLITFLYQTICKILYFQLILSVPFVLITLLFT